MSYDTLVKTSFKSIWVLLTLTILSGILYPLIQAVFAALLIINVCLLLFLICNSE